MLCLAKWYDISSDTNANALSLPTDCMGSTVRLRGLFVRWTLVPVCFTHRWTSTHPVEVSQRLFFAGRTTNPRSLAQKCDDDGHIPRFPNCLQTMISTLKCLGDSLVPVRRNALKWLCCVQSSGDSTLAFFVDFGSLLEHEQT